MTWVSVAKAGIGRNGCHRASWLKMAACGAPAAQKKAAGGDRPQRLLS
ncbi:MAG: hypothetical protein ACFB0E_22570 [Leptolyngbyaceae cyanobacterium]